MWSSARRMRIGLHATSLWIGGSGSSTIRVAPVPGAESTAKVPPQVSRRVRGCRGVPCLLSRAGVEAVAIVFNGQTQSGGVLAHGHLDVVRAGVLDAVVQRFLDDAVDAGLVVFGKVFGNRGGVDGDPDAAAFRDFAGLPLEGGREAEVVEHGGAQQQRHIADHADGGFNQLLDLGGLGGERRESLLRMSVERFAISTRTPVSDWPTSS